MTSATPEPEGALSVTPWRRGWRFTLYGGALAVLVVVVAWVSTHPAELATSSTRVTASTPVSEPVFVGVYDVAANPARILHVSGVRVFATSTADVTLVPHICHGGAIHVTTTPESFCSDFSPTEGETLASGDEIVLEVVGAEPAVVEIDRVRIAYRDGLEWATQDAGAPAQVTILGR